VSTVSVQNAVAPRDLGAATAVMQFFRQLGSALMAALLGALVMGGGVIAEGAALVRDFQLVFLVVAACLALSFFFLMRMEERPLRSDHKTA
jgi:predicted tellurium resistance membrane protein TerC